MAPQGAGRRGLPGVEDPKPIESPAVTDRIRAAVARPPASSGPGVVRPSDSAGLGDSGPKVAMADTRPWLARKVSPYSRRNNSTLPPSAGRLAFPVTPRLYVRSLQLIGDARKIRPAYSRQVG